MLCLRSGSNRKVKQNDSLRPVQDSGTLAVFKVTARDQSHYKGPSGAFYGRIFFHRKSKKVHKCKLTFAEIIVVQ